MEAGYRDMADPDFEFDVIIIGSGFGGSVMTCRLAEKGYRVCLLERGRRYGQNEFPRRINELRKAFWDTNDGMDGLFEILSHPDSDVSTVTASGLGGGSLIYANVLLRMDNELFDGWPGGINRNILDPYYDKVLDTMEASPYPFNQAYYKDTPKTAVLLNAAKNLSTDPEAQSPPAGLFPDLAVRFKGKFPGEQSNNSHGVIQSSCVKCGECNIGCNIHAKNTLDLNYIARARNKNLLGEDGVSAEVRTHAEVVDIVPLDSAGYLVKYLDRGTGQTATIKELRAEKVVVSCGSIGSSGLLLKLKEKGSLPHLSDAIGKKWSGNGDLEGTVLQARDDIVPTKGPVITYAVKYDYKPYPDGFAHQIYIEDAGFPSFLAWYVAGKIPSPLTTLERVKLAWKFLVRKFRKRPEVNLGDDISRMIGNDEYIRHSLLLLGMGRDRSDGEVTLDARGEVVVKWNIEKSRLHVTRQTREMKKLADAMGGDFLLNPLTYLDKLISVHPLGGCVMADSPSEGVVNPTGEVFNYPGLYVVDGSIVPTATGPNPSLTIAALAEYIADNF